MSDGPPKVVFDCMIFAQALISPKGPAGACVELARSRNLSLIISEYVIGEIRELPTKIKPGLKVTPARIEALIEQIEACAEHLGAVPDMYVNPFDKDDSHYINLALAADAQLITSRDGDLLNLMDESRPQGRDFRARFRNLEILPPDQLLERLRQRRP